MDSERRRGGLSRAIRCSSYSYYTTSSFRNFNELTHGCGVWQRGFRSRNMILRQNRHATRFRGLTLQRRALVCVLCPLSAPYIEWVFSLVWQADGLIYWIACGASKVLSLLCSAFCTAKYKQIVHTDFMHPISEVGKLQDHSKSCDFENISILVISC